ncbi:uncharacterized protein LOC141915135 [Tubulanus polymorphus]|uniref:uncharacterized protein LOC141915135 n=1 Tax=Tubulanus polymorphus TaxID=672921 RepID=UPI003DA42F0E
MDRPQGPRKILRSPSLKRKNRPVPLSERVTLERVLGVTVSGNSSLTVCQNTGTIIYPAGCVLIFLNARKNRQSHIINTVKKSISAVCISPDGKYVVTGECGHQPHVRVWDMEEKNVVAEFAGHKFGINCVAFSPNMKHIVSIGSQHDMMVNVWNWRANTKFASNKVSAKVNNVAFSQDGSYFVTVGNRHVKFWYLVATKSRIKETAVLNGRSGILGEQRNNYFTDVACGKGENSESTYCITQSGLLCEFNDKRLLDKWVELRTKSANCITTGENHIFIGCAEGIVRIFSPYTLHFLATLPRPHYIGVDIAAGLDPSHMTTHGNSAKFPDVIACCYDNTNKKLTCVYTDHSLYVWDIKDVKKIGKFQSYLYHSHCVWNVETYPELADESKAALPPGTFMTCSSDDTIRIWNLDPHMNAESGLKRNIYSNDLLKVIYTDEDLNFICDVDYNPAGGTDKTDTSYDGKNGIRTIKISPDGSHLASGDRTGNIRIHSLHFMNEMCLIEAHDSEVLCLEYNVSKQKDPMQLLATASRDRLIHVFDVKKDYTLLQTIDDHSASITAVRFASNDNQLRMLSCGADKSLLFRTAQINPETDTLQFSLNHNLAEKTTLYDMGVDPTNRFVATACQDRNIRIYNVRTGKQRKCYKGTLGDDGTLVKVQLDPTGRYAATSSSDKNLSIIDFMSGDCVASMYAHSEIAPGLQFTNDLKHLITVAGDSCIYIWKLHPEFTEQMKMRREALKQQDITDGQKLQQKMEEKKVDIPIQHYERPSNSTNTPTRTPLEGEDVEYSFNVTQLPAWAKKQLLKGHISSPDYAQRRASIPQSSIESTSVWNKRRDVLWVLHEEIDLNGPMSCPQAPKGRWAQRVDNEGIVIKSAIDENNSVALTLSAAQDRRRFTVEPEVLQDQCRQLDVMRRETMVLSSNKQPPKNVPIIQLEDEDDDDEEFFSLGAKKDDRTTNEEGNPSMVHRASDPEVRRRRFLDSPGIDDEDDDDNATDDSDEQVIYYPTSDDEETKEETENSFHVFALSPEELKRGRNNLRHSDSTTSDPASSRDLDSEMTENTIDDASDEEIESSPTTPLDPNKEFISDPIAKEEYLKQTFDNLGASSMFLSQPEESALTSATGPSHRLSISSKFLSRAQQNHLSFNEARNLAAQAMANQNDKSSAESTSDNSQPSPDLHSPPTKLNNKDIAVEIEPAKKPVVTEGSRTLPRAQKRVSIEPKTTGEDVEESGGLKLGLMWQQPQNLRKSWSISDLSRSQAQSGGRRGSMQRYARDTYSSSLKSRSYARETISSSRSKSEKNLTKVGEEKKKSKTRGIFSKTASSTSLVSREESTVLSTKSSSVTSITGPSSSPRKWRKERLSMPPNFVSSPNLSSGVDEESEETNSTDVSCESGKPGSPLPKTRRNLPHPDPRSLDVQSMVKDLPPSPRNIRRNVSDSFRAYQKPKADTSNEMSKSADSISSVDTDNKCDCSCNEEADRIAMPPPTMLPIAALSRSRKEAFMKRAMKSNQYSKDFRSESSQNSDNDDAKNSDSEMRRVSFSDTISDALSTVSDTPHTRGNNEPSPPATPVSVADIGDASPMDLPVKDQSPVKEPYLERSRRIGIISQNVPVTSAISNIILSSKSEEKMISSATIVVSNINSNLTQHSSYSSSYNSVQTGTNNITTSHQSTSSSSFLIHKVTTTTAISGETVSDRNRDTSPTRPRRESSPTRRNPPSSPSQRRKFNSSPRDVSPKRTNSPRMIRRFDSSPVSAKINKFEFNGTTSKSPSTVQQNTVHSTTSTMTDELKPPTSGTTAKVTLTTPITVSMVTAPKTSPVCCTSTAFLNHLAKSSTSQSAPLVTMTTATSSSNTTITTVTATPVMSASPVSSEQQTSPRKFPRWFGSYPGLASYYSIGGGNSPDRGRLNLPLTTRRLSMSAEDTAIMESCTQTVTDLKRSVLKATNMYQKVQTVNTKMPSDKATHVLETLRNAFSEVRTMIASVDDNSIEDTRLIDRRDSMCQTTEDLAELTDGLSDSMLALFTPLLEQYSNKISDKVISIVQERIMSESTESIGPTLETDC